MHEAAGTGTRLVEGATTTNQSKTATATSSSASWWIRWIGWMCNLRCPQCFRNPERWGMFCWTFFFGSRFVGGCLRSFEVGWQGVSNLDILEFMAVVSLWLVWFRSRCRGSTYSGLSVSWLKCYCDIFSIFPLGSLVPGNLRPHGN